MDERGREREMTGEEAEEEEDSVQSRRKARRSPWLARPPHFGFGFVVKGQ
jgi:hypothetical protein